jgi:hypothetical protein
MGHLAADALGAGRRAEASVIRLLAVAAAVASAWSEPHTLSDTARALGPELAVNSAGSALAVWDSETGPDCAQSPASLTCIHTVKVAARASSTSAWEWPVSIARPGVGAAPRVAVNDAGRAAVIWVHDIGRDRVLQATYRTAPTEAFPNPSDLSAAVLEVRSHRVALDAAGNVVVVWAERHDETFEVAAEMRSAASGTWGAPVVLSTGPVALGPSLAVTPGGDAYVAWIEGVDVKVVHADLARGVWDAPVTLSRAGGYLAGDVVVRANARGDVVASWWWVDRPRGQSIVQAAYKPADQSWHSADDVGDGIRADVALAQDGSAVAAWIDSNGQPRAATRAVGGPWSRPERIGAAATEVRLAVDTRGDAVAVWREDADLMAARRPAGAGWQPVERLSRGEPTSLGVALDSAGNAVATWNVHSGDSVPVLTSDLTDAWEPSLVNTRRPSLRGSARVARTVRCDPGEWTGTVPIRYAYRWLRDGRLRARGSGYRIRPSDLGRRLSCRVTATNLAGTRSATSSAVRVRR